MKAAAYYENGGPEVLKYEDVPDPTCPPDGVVVRVEAVSVEGGDAISRMAEPPPTRLTSAATRRRARSWRSDLRSSTSRSGRW